MIIHAMLSLVIALATFEPPTPAKAPVAPANSPAAPAVAPAPKFTPNITYTSYPRDGAPPLELMLNLAQPADLKPGEARPCIVMLTTTRGAYAIR